LPWAFDLPRTPRRRIRRTGLGLWFFAACVAAAPPTLDLPIQCNLGVDCHIQNFFDHDAGPGWRDHACGSLSYDGHQGTDFRIADRAAMNAGVNVVAAAAGIVKGVRDGEPDISVKQRGRAELHGRDAGNGVRIDHGDGWETQYSHLRRGSLAVRVGQRVEAGTVLGRVGLSGNTEFPHVDFSVRHHGKTVDPFAPDGGACGTDGPTLWAAGLKQVLRYRASGLLRAGFADAFPEIERIAIDSPVTRTLAADSPAMVFWMELFGLQKGDILEIALFDPDGRRLASNRRVADGDKAVWRAAVGKRRVGGAWAPGNYTGRVILRRGEEFVIDEARTIPLQ
jgi:murein DD-endopeptidase MepM/ murein hydrolase activator NlpD